MVAIQVLPLEPDPWPDSEAHDDTGTRRDEVPSGGRLLPDRATRYRRRRLGALLSLVVLSVAAFAVVDVLATVTSPAPRPTVGDDAGGPIVGDTYVVQPGDTLWSIAERMAPGDDPRHVVAELNELVGGVELDVGDRIPVGELSST
jgi:hypothetical protein